MKSIVGHIQLKKIRYSEIGLIFHRYFQETVNIQHQKLYEKYNYFATLKHEIKI